MDDLESIISRAMQAHQKLQDAHTQRAATVTPRELDRKQMSIDEAIAKVRCIPARFRPIVHTILQDGVPASLSTLALALDVDGSAVPFVTLVGKTGAGKTSTALALPVARFMLAYAATWGKAADITGDSLVHTAKFTKQLLPEAHYTWRFMHADDLCNCRKFSKLGETPKAIEDAMDKRPLIIDDIIGQRDADGDLYAVLRHREENALATIFTTGLSREDISTTYGALFARRLFSGAVHLIGGKR